MSSGQKTFRDAAAALGIIAVCMAAMYILGGKFCYFKAFFGLPCPGCGLTRASVSFVKGDIAAAFFYHPLFLLVWALFALAGVSLFSAGARSFFRSNTLWICMLAVFSAVYVVRMFLFFPHTKPFDINYHAVISKLISLIPF